MNPFEEFLVELLQGNITYNENVVEVRREFNPEGVTPCITLDIASITTDWVYYKDNVPRASRSIEMNIHSWCNTEKERESINNQILTCFHECYTHNSKYCTSYDEGVCGTTGTPCSELHCVNPLERGYECLSEKYGLGYSVTMIEPPFFSDEYTEHPPILHSIFRANSAYDEPLVATPTSDIITNMEYDTELLNIRNGEI